MSGLHAVDPRGHLLLLLGEERPKETSAMLARPGACVQGDTETSAVVLRQVLLDYIQDGVVSTKPYASVMCAKMAANSIAREKDRNCSCIWGLNVSELSVITN